MIALLALILFGLLVVPRASPDFHLGAMASCDIPATAWTLPLSIHVRLRKQSEARRKAARPGHCWRSGEIPAAASTFVRSWEKT